MGNKLVQVQRCDPSDGGQGCVITSTTQQVASALHTISQRVASFLERRGILERDEGNSYLNLDGLDEDPMQELHSH